MSSERLTGGRFLEVTFFARSVGTLRYQKSIGKKGIISRCGKRKHEGTQGQWQQEPTHKEVLQQIKWHPDTDCNAYTMRRTRGDQATGKASKRNFSTKESAANGFKLGFKEASDKVASEDVGRLGITQDILRKSTDFLRRRKGRSYLVVCLPAL